MHAAPGAQRRQAAALQNDRASKWRRGLWLEGFGAFDEGVADWMAT